MWAGKTRRDSWTHGIPTKHPILTDLDMLIPLGPKLVTCRLVFIDMAARNTMHKQTT